MFWTLGERCFHKIACDTFISPPQDKFNRSSDGCLTQQYLPLGCDVSWAWPDVLGVKPMPIFGSVYSFLDLCQPILFDLSHHPVGFINHLAKYDSSNYPHFITSYHSATSIHNNFHFILSWNSRKRYWIEFYRNLSELLFASSLSKTIVRALVSVDWWN